MVRRFVGAIAVGVDEFIVAFSSLAMDFKSLYVLWLCFFFLLLLLSSWARVFAAGYGTAVVVGVIMVIEYGLRVYLLLVCWNKR